MSADPLYPRSVKFLRWVARIWSILISGVALLMVFVPDPYSTNELLPIKDIILLSLWGVAIFGLLIAWRWERLGALITIAAMFIRELVWVMLNGGWLAGFLIPWVFIVPPAVIFLTVSYLERKASRA
ncbi:MAG: hypothetical protein FD147_2474 [Chloroflexi bacterium]|nr:MAG: hypothetical protein FD147_2474 [Chloroflexota bacterium]MBA4376749.1 hypothetical protein [Anaerolinea sp.]